MDRSRTRAAGACIAAFIGALAATVWLALEHSGRPLSLARIALATTVLAVTAFLRVRLRYGRREVAVDLTEAAIVVALFGLPPAFVPAAVAIGVTAGELMRRRLAPLAVAQWTLGAAGAAIAYATLRSGWDFTARNVAALVTAMVVVGLVNVGMTALTRRAGAAVHALEWSVSVPIGVLFAGAYATSTALVPLFLVPVVLLYLAAKGLASEQANRARMEGLQRATHVLAQPVDPREALAPFLDEVVAAFDADSALLEMPGGQRLEAGDPGAGGPSLRAAVALGTEDGEIVVTRSSDAETFESVDGAVLDAIARELSASIEKSGLLAAVLDERKKLGEIVDSTSDGIFTLDANGGVTSWNPAMETISGHDSAAVSAARGLDLLQVADARGEGVDLSGWPGADDLPAELQIRHRSGDTRWLDCSYSRTGAEGGQLIVVARDRTGAHELERLKQDFVSIVSHELRTPITPIKGFANSLLRGNETMAPDSRRKAAESILRQAQRLERLIMNLLEVSKLERGTKRSELEEVELGAVCRNVVEELLPAWPGSTIEVQERGEGVVVSGRDLWVDQIVANLISNALKYGGAQVPVIVRIDRNGDSGVVAVIDHGPGIPAEEQERIFGRFERMHQHDMQAGTGLGLYIARQLAEAMGGTLTVTSEVGVGSTFELRLATAPVAASVG